MGEAIGYALGQWDALTLFLTDPHLPIDNNASERALRVAALGRKNFLFVGTDEAGENLAGLYSLIATCEANGVNPVDYLADVLLRVQTPPGLADRRAAAAQLEPDQRRYLRVPAMPIARSRRCRSPVPAKAITRGVTPLGRSTSPSSAPSSSRPSPS